MGSSGDLIDTLFLYSEQAQDLLRQALEREKAQGDGGNKKQKQPNNAKNGANGGESSDSEEEGEGEGEEEPPAVSSSSSSEGEEEDEEEEAEDSPLLAAAEESPSNADKTNLQPPKQQNRKKKKKKPAKQSQTEQQRQYTIKKYVENLTCDILPVNDNQALHVPVSLLGKTNDAAIAERNYVAQSSCQEYLELSQKLSTTSKVLVILLRSGKFAAGIFQQRSNNNYKCLVHRVCTRYTIRGGQGKAQSSQDASGRKPKSMGAQLRRQGEEALQQDIADTVEQWKTHIATSSLILLSCPKAMRKYFFDAVATQNIIPKKDPRIRRLPLDIGRPNYENVCIAYQVMMTVQLKQYHRQVTDDDDDEENNKKPAAINSRKAKEQQQQQQPANNKEPDIVFPLTPMHEACRKGDLETITHFLSDLKQLVTCQNEHGEDVQLHVDTMIQRRAGPNFMTCLHYAAGASSNNNSANNEGGGTTGTDNGDAVTTTINVEPDIAAACVSQLLLQGKADPTQVDVRNRPPYFMANHDKVRDAFRLARSELGEDYCKWDTVAKVGPALKQSDVEARKEKEAEKKRKKRARQKQKKAAEKAQAAADEKQRLELEETRKKEEEAKRVRDGLQPKAASGAVGGSVCDFCQRTLKRRFSRLEYVYCSTECVQKHKRELMAAAAMSRFVAN